MNEISVIDSAVDQRPGALQIDPDTGRLLYNGRRMLLLSACSLGALRKELIETLGYRQARRVLKRFGFAAGRDDAHNLPINLQDMAGADPSNYGFFLHALDGLCRFEAIEEKCEVDLTRGVFHIEAYWASSFEAEQHVKHFGQAKEPVCWILTGYATGHSTELLGKKTLVKEVECRGMGHPRCRIVADFDASFSEEFDAERQDYHEIRFSDLVAELNVKLQHQQAELERKEKTISQLQARLGNRPGFEGMIGDSPAFRRALRMAEQVASVDSTVLILGESGTGKDLLARAIHECSRRADRPFVAVNCSALPETLQEAELFGYARGAFTGATRNFKGLFESAHGGTLFLDEIGDLSLSAQAKILRALQSGEIKRIGESKIRKVDVRIIAATHQDLEQMVQERRFREDLYYRLNVVSITLPPLRERDNDLLLLAEAFVRKFSDKWGKSISGLSCVTKRLLLEYPWPGNVRELENAMERAVILAEGPVIEPKDLPEKIIGYGQQGVGLQKNGSLQHQRESLSGIVDERERIARALAMSKGKRELAAALLDCSRTTLWRKMKAYGML